MPVYAYKGLNSSGKEVKGVVDAESPKVLRTQLRKEGIRERTTAYGRATTPACSRGRIHQNENDRVERRLQQGKCTFLLWQQG